MKHNRSDFEKFHNYSALIPQRIIYFGSEEWDGENEGGVDFASARKLIKNLLFLDSLNRKLITVYINTPGGCEFNGMAVYDVIKTIKSPVKGIGIGQVMSMGTVILQACRYRYLTKNCTFMIHNGTFGVNSETKSFEAWGEWSKKSREVMYKIYYNQIKKVKPRITLKQVEEMCAHDNLMDAESVVRLGLADKVIK